MNKNFLPHNIIDVTRVGPFWGSMGQFADIWAQENSSAVEHKLHCLALGYDVQFRQDLFKAIKCPSSTPDVGIMSIIFQSVNGKATGLITRSLMSQ